MIWIKSLSVSTVKRPRDGAYYFLSCPPMSGIHSNREFLRDNFIVLEQLAHFCTSINHESVSVTSHNKMHHFFCKKGNCLECWIFIFRHGNCTWPSIQKDHFECRIVPVHISGNSLVEMFIRFYLNYCYNCLEKRLIATTSCYCNYVSASCYKYRFILTQSLQIRHVCILKEVKLSYPQ